MQALVIGYGSIGARHARLLTELGCSTSVVSNRQIDFPRAHRSLAAAFASQRPDYVVVANSTHLHYDTLQELIGLGFSGTLLVEKPVFHRHLQLVLPPPSRTFVAYNLRFHPIIERLRALLKTERVLSVQAYVGQYLPDWRPTTDYRESYSASAAKGGGVLRDLSHELDYLTWILGGWSRVSALGGRLSSLEVSSDDLFALLLETPLCPAVSLQLNYLDRVGRRTILVNTDRHTFEADLGRGTLTVDRASEEHKVGRDDTYRAMHAAALAGTTNSFCTFEEGLETMKLIEAVERAARDRDWVAR